MIASVLGHVWLRIERQRVRSILSIISNFMPMFLQVLTNRLPPFLSGPGRDDHVNRLVTWMQLLRVITLYL